MVFVLGESCNAIYVVLLELAVIIQQTAMACPVKAGMPWPFASGGVARKGLLFDVAEHVEGKTGLDLPALAVSQSDGQFVFALFLDLQSG